MSAERQGSIVAVCKSPRHGFPTYPVESVRVNLDGIAGDAHSGPLRESFTGPETLKANDRPISMVADEVRQKMNRKFGLYILPGGFNEQLLVQSVGDMHDVEVGYEVEFANGVRLQVVDHAFPCDKLVTYHGEPGLRSLEFHDRDKVRRSRRGVLAKVLAPGELTAGESDGPCNGGPPAGNFWLEGTISLVKNS